MQNYKIGSGLENLGNTCFFNAVIQSILYTQPLSMQLQAKSHSKKCQKNQWCVFCELQQIWYHTRNSKVYAPTSMIKNLKNIFKKFKLGRQQDSHQLLRYLIEGMQTAQVGKPLKDRKENEEKIKKSTTFKIFGGELRTCVHCLSCNFRSLTEERYYDMNIECQKSNSLQEGLHKFFEVDKLSGSNKYNCQKCKTHSEARKRFYIVSAPEIMTFQFKRFTNTLRKIGKFIKFPKKINLSPYFEQKRKVFMELYAVIVHAGGTSWSGHYYAFVKVGDIWYRMDDMRVSKCSQESVLSQNAYLVFYRKTIDEKIQNQSKQKKHHESQTCTITIKSKEVSKNLQESLQQKNKQTKPKQNGIKVDGILQGILYKKKQQHKNGKKNQQLESTYETQIQVPNQLIKTRSKQQANRETPLAEMLLKYAQSLMSLQMKLQRPRHRSLDRLRSLRKYELTMKRRKMG